jgi:DNA-binding SARP family transcriptional activator
MVNLRVSLFQTLQIFSSEGDSIDLGSPTNRTLVAYLLLNRTNLIDRRRMAFIFWPQSDESSARRNLRQYIHRIRRTLEKVDPAGHLIQADESIIQIDPKAQIWTDVDEFRSKSGPDASLDDMRSAVALYTGDLLEDIYEDWCQPNRRQLRQTYIGLLDRLSQGLQAQNHLEEALFYAQKWVDAETLDEAAHRRYLSLLALARDRNRAIIHYKHLKKILAGELNTEPLPETQALYRSIQEGPLDHSASPSSIPPPTQPLLSSPVALPLVGRQSELSHLDQIYTSAQTGQGHFILVTGESGIGKTRLVQEFLSQYPDIPTLYGVCHELELTAPYAPLKQALSNSLELVPESMLRSPPPWAFTLAHFLPSLARRMPFLVVREISASQDSQSIPEALTSLLLTLTEHLSGSTLCLILDDLHWGDNPTWDFLSFISRYAATQPWIIFGLCRLEDAPPERLRLIRRLERNNLLIRLPLSRLSPQETAQIAAHLLPEKPLDSLFLSRLYKETEGNPFFVIETLRAMKESGHPPTLTVDRTGRIQAFSLPLSVQHVIEARLDRLSPQSQELLAVAAAIGRAFTFSMLIETGQIPAAQGISFIEEWLQRGLVREAANTYDFSHDKVRQVAYATMSRARRQYIHRQIATVLETTVPPTDPATLAYHYARSDQPLQALPHLTKAGEQALQVRSYQEARQFGLRAVSLLGRLPGPHQRSERIELNLQLAQAYAFSGDLLRALEILTETEYLATNLGGQENLGKVFHRLSQIFWLRGQPEVSGDYARRALRFAEDQEDPLLLQASLRMLGRTSIALSAFDDAIAYLQRYTRLEYHAPRPLDLPIILGYLGIAFSRVGSWDWGLRSAQKGLSLAEAEGSSQTIAFARMQLGFIHAERFNWERCLDVLEPIPDPLESNSQGISGSRPIRRTDGNSLTPFGFMLLSLRGRTLAHLGRPDQAIKLIRPAIQWVEQNDYKVFHYFPSIFLMETLSLAKDIPAALAQGQKALNEAKVAGDRWAAGVTLRTLAEIHGYQPNPDWTLMEDLLITSMQMLRHVRARPDLARTYLSLRRLYDRAGQIAWAVDCHFRATTIFEELAMIAELRQAQGQAAGERSRAVVIPDMRLRGPDVAFAEP